MYVTIKYDLKVLHCRLFHSIDIEIQSFVCDFNIWFEIGTQLPNASTTILMSIFKYLYVTKIDWQVPTSFSMYMYLPQKWCGYWNFECEFNISGPFY